MRDGMGVEEDELEAALEHGGGRRARSGKEGEADRRRRRPMPKETLGGAAGMEKREV